MKNIIPITEARRRIFALVDEIYTSNERYLLTEKGRAKAVIMSATEFDSWQETLEAIKDFPHLDKNIQTSRKEFEKGDYIKLEELLEKEGYIVADRPRKHEISSHHSKKRSKKT